MKDISRHMNKINKKVIKNASDINTEEYNWEKEFRKPQNAEEIKKQKKQMLRKEGKKKLHPVNSPEEKNKKQRHREPQIRERKHQS